MNAQLSLDSVLAALRAQRILILTIVGLGILLGSAAALLVHPKYTAASSVLMVADEPESQSSKSLPVAKQPLLSADLPALATSTTVLERLSQDIRWKGTLGGLKGRIRAKATGDSSIMTLQYTAKQSDEAIEGANALADEVVRSYRELATERFDSLIGDLRTELAARRKQLTSLDTQLESFAKDYPYVDVSATQSGSSDPSSVYGRFIALRTERDELQAAVRGDAATAATMSRVVVDAVPSALREIVNNDSVYRTLHDQYARDLAQLKRLESFGTTLYPGLSELRETVAREASGVATARRRAEAAGPLANPNYAQALDAKARADAQLDGDRAKLAGIDMEIAALNADVARNGIANKVARVRRDRQNIELDYAALGERLIKTIGDRAEAASTGSVIVMDRAAYSESAGWSGGKVIAVGLVFFSIWLAVSLALAIEGAHERFGKPGPAERIYGAPVLGSVA